MFLAPNPAGSKPNGVPVSSIAFQTGEGTQEVEKSLNQEEMISYFIPTTPNPTSGFHLIIDEAEVRESHFTVEEAFKTILSLGIAQPSEKSGG